MTTRRVILILTVLALVLAAAASVAVAAPQTTYACAAYHTVRFGETLNSISQMYGVSVQALMAANNIYNPNMIYAGQTLCIPGGAPVPPPPPGPPPPSCGTYYTVQWGDTLSRIAARYGTSVQAIMYANNITNPNYVYAGMILYIPCGRKPPAPGPTYSQWKGEYFNNQDLAGAPSVVRNDSAIAFNWGLGWPNPKISADHFSVRWTRTLNASEGTYRFTVNVDDGTRLWVDNILVLDQWDTYSGQAFTVDVPLGAGNHVVRMEYFEDTGIAFAYLTYAYLGPVGPTQPYATPIPGQAPTPPATGTTGGAWTCTYYADQNLSDPVASVIVPGINFNWEGRSPYPGVPRNLWSMRCTSVQGFNSGLYQFNAKMDDGARVFVDNKAVISSWTNHAGAIEVGTINLGSGAHMLQVDYYQIGHDSLLTVWWDRK